MKFVDAHNLAGQIPNLKARVSQHLDKECLDQDKTKEAKIWPSTGDFGTYPKGKQQWLW